MNLILLSEDDLSGSGKCAVITGRRHKHILEILKSTPGDELVVGVIDGNIGKGRIVAINDKSVEIEVILSKEPPHSVPGTLVLAMPRPIVFNRLLGHITALGIKKIILIHSKRVEKSYWKSPVLKEENIRAQLILGLEQAKDTIVPDVSCRMKFKSFVENELPCIVKGTRAFVAHPETKESIPCGLNGAFTLVIGPEGGFLPDEIDALKRAGCRCVSLGGRILRVETAVVAALSRLSSS
ncbi:MAG: 16S rRNA (uracil(1498)-N(3))-methyltransferase [Candidatus Omnitrophota bacterium]